MWTVSGVMDDRDQFGRLEAIKVLIQYDGPRTFTFADRFGQLCLAHWLDEDRDCMRFAVVRLGAAQLLKLEQCEIAIRDALDQYPVFIVDQLNSGEVRDVWKTRLADLPQDVLPVQGTLVSPELEKRRRSGSGTSLNGQHPMAGANLGGSVVQPFGV